MCPFQHWHCRRSMWLIFPLAILVAFLLGTYSTTAGVLRYASNKLDSAENCQAKWLPFAACSPADALYTAATAMQQLKSAHFALALSAQMTVPSSLSTSSTLTTLNTPGQGVVKLMLTRYCWTRVISLSVFLTLFCPR